MFEDIADGILNAPKGPMGGKHFPNRIGGPDLQFSAEDLSVPGKGTLYAGPMSLLEFGMIKSHTHPALWALPNPGQGGN